MFTQEEYNTLIHTCLLSIRSSKNLTVDQLKQISDVMHKLIEYKNFGEKQLKKKKKPVQA